jgi:hypothetical protein
MKKSAFAALLRLDLCISKADFVPVNFYYIFSSSYDSFVIVRSMWGHPARTIRVQISALFQKWGAGLSGG